MSDLIDMVELVKELTVRPRGKACFVFSDDINGRYQWAARLAELTDSKHMDMLEVFNNNQALADKTSIFGVTDFCEMIKNEKNSPSIIVTGTEFLLSIWANQSDGLEELATKMEMWSNKPAMLLVLQQNRDLAEREFTRHPHLTMKINQSDTKAIL